MVKKWGKRRGGARWGETAKRLGIDDRGECALHARIRDRGGLIIPDVPELGEEKKGQTILRE